MELTSAQRIVTFGVVVLVLAGLGAYLFLPRPSAGAAPRVPPSPSVHGPTSPARFGSPSASASPPTSARVPDIYNWLPFSASGLAAAARVTTAFAADYGTFSYRESATSYLGPMKLLISDQLAELLGRAYSAPGVVASRTSGREVDTASAVITALRAFGPSSLTFAVTLTERTKGAKGTGQQVTDYAITLTGSGSNWQVTNIELASVGNQ
jgi:hypothetical protein